MLKKITVIGTDSTHCVAFARLLKESKEHGWEISYAIRDLRSHLNLSQQRYQNIETQMEALGVKIFDSLTPELVSSTDAFIIASVDASLHLSQFATLVGYAKPIFIDKPITYSVDEMDMIFQLATEHNQEVMTSSSLRFSAAVLQVKSMLIEKNEQIKTIKLFGPMPIEAEIPGMYWYGIHLIELLLTISEDKFEVLKIIEEKTELIIICQSQGTVCEFYGDLSGQGNFKGIVETKQQVLNFDQGEDKQPLYAYLVKAMLDYFETGRSPVSPEQTKEVISLVEKINDKGGWTK